MIRTYVFMYKLLKTVPCQSILWTSVIECFMALTKELEQCLGKDFKQSGEEAAISEMVKRDPREGSPPKPDFCRNCTGYWGKFVTSGST